MAAKGAQQPLKPRETEIGAVRKSWQGRIRVALAYPNTYPVGMSNLGFQAVYAFLNGIDGVVCERVFLPDEGRVPAGSLSALESGRRVAEFDILAFSVSFENDYPGLLGLLELAGMPLKARERAENLPLVVAGGVTAMLNPEPLAPFVDCFLIGEAEAILPDFLAAFDPAGDRRQTLLRLAREVPGAYVPSLYRPEYRPDGRLKAFVPLADVPPTILRQRAADFAGPPLCSAVLTDRTPFDRTFLVEIGRGCPHGCRFCSAGFIYRPPRFRTIPALLESIRQGRELTDRVGLVGAAVSDLPGLGELLLAVRKSDGVLSFSSFRADAIDETLLAALRQSRVKTATIAPDAGSERMRRVINKGLAETTILAAAETLVAGGIPNLKLYFMLGLPTETAEDVTAIVALCRKIKDRFLAASREKGKIGTLRVSLSAFVPKPFTPFQWAAMDEIKILKQKVKAVRDGLKPVPNVVVHTDNPRWSYLQAVLARGDRRAGEMLLAAHENRGNWPKTFKEASVPADWFALRQRPLDELLPWEFIDHGLSRKFLVREYRQALQGKSSRPCPLEGCERCGVCGI